MNDTSTPTIDECHELGRASIETRGPFGTMIEPSAIGRPTALTDD